MMCLKAAGEYKTMWAVPVDKGALNGACADIWASNDWLCLNCK